MAYYNLLFLLSQLLCAITAQYVGSSCGNGSGVCKVVTDCPHMLERIKRGERYDRCGFRDFAEVICCPSATEATTRISEQKCKEYSDAVYGSQLIAPLTPDADPRIIKIDRCGHKVVQLVVGGEAAHPREFPHMALIGYGPKEDNEPAWLCGGTLISNRYVLTAAHCKYAQQYGDAKFVRLGDLNVYDENDEAEPENYNVIDIKAYPNYTIRLKYNDIALLKLDRDVVLSPYKRPACLRSIISIEENVLATGWGLTDNYAGPSSHLQKVVLEKFSFQECNESFNEYDSELFKGIEDNTQICYGSRTLRRDTCSGDSGGPLQIFHPSLYCMYSIVGITSFGPGGCGNPGVPGVYTRVATYLEWIEKEVWG